MQQHLMACERCRETLTLAVIALRDTSAPDGSFKPSGQHADQEVRQKVHEIMTRLEDERAQ